MDSHRRETVLCHYVKTMHGSATVLLLKQIAVQSNIGGCDYFTFCLAYGSFIEGKNPSC
jgi:hypothetical protein